MRPPSGVAPALAVACCSTLPAPPLSPRRAPLPQVAERLQEAIRGLQGLVNDLRAACEEVVNGAGRAKKEVEASRHALKAALRWVVCLG